MDNKTWYNVQEKMYVAYKKEWFNMGKTQKKSGKESKRSKEEKARFEKIISMDDNKINVLVLGTSGCGKSTLINAILDSDDAKTGVGEAVTKKIQIYQNDSLPFRMIDSVGYEYGVFRQTRIKRDIAKFCKEGIKNSDVEKLIHIIWFCIDGTTKRIDQEVLGYMQSVTNDWKDVPILVVFTKSYSQKEIKENMDMANAAFAKYNERHKKHPLNLYGIVPVVAKTYQIDDDTVVPASGLDALIEKTNDLAPDAKKIGNAAIKAIDVKLKNASATAVVGLSSISASVVGATPLPDGVKHSAILVPIQGAMMKGVASVYGLQGEINTNEIIDTLIKVGATTFIGRKLLSALQLIPGVQAIASFLSAAVAGSVTMIAGIASNIVFKKAYLKELELKSIDWESVFTKTFNEYLPDITEALTKLFTDNGDKLTLKQLGEFLTALTPKILHKSDEAI